MENDDEARKSLLDGNRRSQTDPSTRTYYDMQQPSSTTVSDFREIMTTGVSGGASYKLQVTNTDRYKISTVFGSDWRSEFNRRQN